IGGSPRAGGDRGPSPGWPGSEAALAAAAPGWTAPAFETGAPGGGAGHSNPGAADPRGRPEQRVSPFDASDAAARMAERGVTKPAVGTEDARGAGTVTVKVDDEEGGPYVLRLTGTDRFGNLVIAERAVMISGAKDADRLRLLSDRLRFRVGEPARVS